MNKLFTTTIQKKWVFTAVFAALALFGYYSWTQMSIEAYPDIADVTSQVVTQVPGLAAEEIEQQITIPLERALNGLPGMHVMRSKSTFGLSLIVIVFEDGVEDYWSRQRIQERLNEVDLPYDAVPELDPLTSPIGEIYRYIVESDRHSLRELTDMQLWKIIPKLREIPGVIDVANFGGITTQFQAEINPNKLLQYDLSLMDVVEAIEENNANAGGSILNRGDLLYVVRGVGLVSSLEDIGNIVVASENGVPVFVSDVATMRYGEIQRVGVMGYTDRERNYSETVAGIVCLLRHENPSKVLNGIHKMVDELNNSILPEGVRIVPYLDRTDLVDTTIRTVGRSMIEGILLVIIVLIIFLGSWRSALLVSVTIPLALLISFILMQLFGIPANLLSLGAISFGVLVDASIVMLETILKKRENNPQTYFDEQTIVKRMASVGRPILFAGIIMIVTYLPLFAFERVEHKLFTPMAFTVSFALIGATLVALFLIPGMTYALYRKPQKIYRNKWLERLIKAYSNSVNKLIVKPKAIVVTVVIVLFGAIGLSMSVGKDFLPTLDEGSIWLQVKLPPGITLEKSSEISDTLRARTMKYPEVTYIAVQAGRNDEGTDPWTPSHFEVSIGIKPYSEWARGKRKDDLIDELDAEFATIPGILSVGFTQPMIDGIMDKIAGAHSELVVKIFGDDVRETRRIAEDVLATLRNVRGAVDLAIDQEPPLPQMQINVDRRAIARHGMNVSDVTEFIEIAIGGRPVSQIYQDDRVYDITARFREDTRDTPEKIGNLRIMSPAGAHIPLAQLANITLTTGESTITREMNKRHITVKLNLRDRDLSSFLREANRSIESNVEYDHAKYTIEWGGQFENQQRAYARLAIIVPMALMLIFLLLYGTFGKARQAGLVLIIVPLAIFGGMLALNLRGMTLNVSSAVGFIALFGIAITNGVLMVSHINDLRKKGLSLLNSVKDGARQRFRPILMTSIVAMLGLLPASIATGIGSDVQRPLATVIVYGLMFSVFLTIYVLPVFYYLVEAYEIKKLRRKQQ
jgi:cobalt-zinc-cadmium resistance protein CzcA